MSPPGKTVQFDLRPGGPRKSYREPDYDPGYETDDSDSTIETLRPRRSRSRSRSRSRRRRRSRHRYGHRFPPNHHRMPIPQPPAPGFIVPPRRHQIGSDPTIPNIAKWRDPSVGVVGRHKQGYRSDPEEMRSPPQINSYSQHQPQHHVPQSQAPPPLQQPQQQPPEQNTPPSPFPAPIPQPPQPQVSPLQPQAPHPDPDPQSRAMDQKTVDKVEHFLNGLHEFVQQERDLWRKRNEGGPEESPGS